MAKGQKPGSPLLALTDKKAWNIANLARKGVAEALNRTNLELTRDDLAPGLRRYFIGLPAAYPKPGEAPAMPLGHEYALQAHLEFELGASASGRDGDGPSSLNLAGIYLRVRREPGGGAKQQLFRAEWHLTGDVHAQPHWHVDDPAGMKRFHFAMVTAWHVKPGCHTDLEKPQHLELWAKHCVQYIQLQVQSMKGLA